MGRARWAGFAIAAWAQQMIYEGDCLAIMPALPAASVDMILTDPPYGLNFNNGDLAHQWEAALGRGEAGEARPILGDSPEEWEPLMRGFLKEARRVLKAGACCCCCCGGGGPQPIFARLTLWLDEYLQFKQAVVWDKGGLGMGWHYRRSYEFMLVAQKPGGPVPWYGGNSTSNVLRIGKIIPNGAEHPTQKPVELMEFFVRLHTRPGDLVLDPFCGSGTTGVAAQRLGRKFIGIEKDPRWAAVARVRTGEANESDEKRLLDGLPLFGVGMG